MTNVIVGETDLSDRPVFLLSLLQRYIHENHRNRLKQRAKFSILND